MSTSGSSGTLDGAVKPTLAALGGGGVMSIFALMGFGNWRAWVVVGTFIVLAAICIVIYMLLQKRKEKQEVQRGNEEIYERIREQPARVSDPGKLGRIAALSVKLEEVVRKYRDLGHNLADKDLPWYLLVGETGSGKSEAIRRSGIDFPPGMNNEHQGAGGTVNMDWWFTENGIILDTAGRLLVEQDESQSLEELKRFLQFVRKVRRACPINGMLLVLPADSLLKDSTEAISSKSGQIAKRLDLMRRALGVRFPVFVVITKSDLIPGFRAFFSDLNSPELQHQMLGWSNPRSLNEPFDPSDVEQHLQVVRSRLVKRRTSLLLDPVHTEDPSASRLEQVDALYQFPEAFVRLAPNLRLYLQKIFTKSKFSPEPLFLRGIYFTSSMEEGAEVDDAVAKLLGLPVEQLQQEGRGHKRERAVFLSDLFNKKVFVEKGLVTRSNESDPEGILRRQKFKLLGAAAAAVTILVGFTWLGQSSLSSQIEPYKELWTGLDSRRQSDWETWKNWNAVVSKDNNKPYEYGGQSQLQLTNEKLKLEEFFSDRKEVNEDPVIPLVFRWTGLFSTDVKDLLPPAKKAVYDTKVLRPLVEAVVSRMSREMRGPTGQAAGNLWSGEGGDAAVAALTELLRIQASGTGMLADGKGSVQLKSLFDYALKGAADKAKCDAALPIFQKVHDEVYPQADGRKGSLMFVACANLQDKQDSLAALVRSFSAYVKEVGTGSSTSLKAIDDLKTAVGNFASQEQKLLALKDRPAPATRQDYDDRVREWQAAFAPLVAMEKDLEQRAKAAGLTGDMNERPLDQLFQERSANARTEARKQIAAVAAVFAHDTATNRSAAAASEADSVQQGRSTRNRDELENAGKSLQGDRDDPKVAEQLRGMYRDYLAPTASGAAFRVRFTVYSRVNEVVSAPPQKLDLANAQQIAAAISTRQWENPANVQDLRSLDLPGDRKWRDDVQATCGGYMIEKVYVPFYRYNVISQLLSALRSNTRIEDLVKNCVLRPDDVDKTFASPWDLPLTGSKGYKEGYRPDQAAAIVIPLSELSKVGQKPPAGGAGIAVVNPKELENQLSAPLVQYLKQYLNYWSEGINEDLRPPKFADWTAAQKELGRLDAAMTNAKLTTITEARLKAIDKLAAQMDPGDVQKVRVPLISQQDSLKPQNAPIYGTAITNWAVLDGNAALAKQTLMNLKPPEFNQKYGNTLAGVFYWKQAMIRSVQAIGAGGQAPGESFNILKGYSSKFPLGLGPEISSNDVIPLRNAMSAVEQALPETANAPGQTIGKGATVGDREIDDCLAEMRGTLTADQARDALGILEKCKKFGLELPGQCTVVLLIDQKTWNERYKTHPLAEQWPWLNVNQKPVPDEVQPKDKDLGTLQYGTGADNSFTLQVAPAGPNQKNPPPPISVRGMWAPLRLLQQNPRLFDAESKSWILQFRYEPEPQLVYALWLRLKFSTELPPEVATWPVQR